VLVGGSQCTTCRRGDPFLFERCCSVLVYKRALTLNKGTEQYGTLIISFYVYPLCMQYKYPSQKSNGNPWVDLRQQSLSVRTLSNHLNRRCREVRRKCQRCDFRADVPCLVDVVQVQARRPRNYNTAGQGDRMVCETPIGMKFTSKL